MLFSPSTTMGNFLPFNLMVKITVSCWLFLSILPAQYTRLLNSGAAVLKATLFLFQMAVTGMFVAAAIKELRQLVLPTMVSLVRHYTMVAIAQQAGPFALSAKQSKLGGMDPLVLIDALAVIMGHEEKELCKVSNTPTRSSFTLIKTTSFASRLVFS